MTVATETKTPATAEFRPWLASLHLAFDKRDGVTRPTRREHYGPLRALRGFSAPSGCPDLFEQIIVHPPGGIAAGDELTINLEANPQTRTIFTSPGAAKWYRAAQALHNQPARQDVTIRVGRGASLEWMPMENIVFDSARATLTTTVSLAHEAQFIGADMFCLGRPANKERFATGQIKTRTTLLRNETPIFHEQFVLTGDDPALDSRAGLNGATCFANLLIVPATVTQETLEQLCHQIREALRVASVQDTCVVTTLSQLVVVRWHGAHAETGWSALRIAWQAARPIVNGLSPIRPRIWNC